MATLLLFFFTIVTGIFSFPWFDPDITWLKRLKRLIRILFGLGLAVSVISLLPLPDPQIRVSADNEFIFYHNTASWIQPFASVEYDISEDSRGKPQKNSCGFDEPVNLGLPQDSRAVLSFHTRGLVAIGGEQHEDVGVDEFGRKWVGKKPEPIYVEFSAEYLGKTYKGYEVKSSDIKVTGIDKKGDSHAIEGFEFHLDEKYREDTKLKLSTQKIHVVYETDDGQKYSCECRVDGVHEPLLTDITASLLDTYKKGILLSQKLEPSMFKVRGIYEDGSSDTLKEFQIDPTESDVQGDRDVIVGAEGKTAVVTIHWIERFVTEEKEQNDTFSAANELALNSSVRGTIADRDDVDFFSFLLPSDKKGRFSFKFEHALEDDANVCWKVELLQTDDIPLLSCTSKRSEAKVFSGNTRIAGGSWYFVKVSPDYGQSNDRYELTVSFEEEGNFFEKEPNDQQQQATEIDPRANTPYVGNLTSSSDRDYYHMALDQKGVIQAAITHDKRENDYIGWKLSVIGKDGNDIDSITSSGGTAEAKTGRYRVPAGDCWLKVERGSNWSDHERESNMDYGLRVTYTPEGDESEAEPNDNFKSEASINPKVEANPIVNGQEMAGNIHTGDDKDFYYLDYDGAGGLALDFKHQRVDSNQILWQVSLMGPASNALKNVDGDELLRIRGSEAEGVHTTWNGLAPGRYHVKVESYYGSYRDDDYALRIAW